MSALANDLAVAAAASAVFVGIALIASWIRKRVPNRPEWSRKTGHVLALAAAMACYPLLRSAVVPIVLSVMLAAVMIGLRIAGRDEFLRVPGSSMIGELLIPVDLAVFSVLARTVDPTGPALPALSAAALLTLMLADTAASLSALTVGRTAIPGSGKTLEGSFAFVAAGLPSVVVPLVAMAGYNLLRALLSGFVAVAAGSLAELWSPCGTDNVAVPLAVFFVLLPLHGATTPVLILAAGLACLVFAAGCLVIKSTETRR
jgi:hypothetical protein